MLPTAETVSYECHSCGLDYLLEEGVITCAAHFYCDECLTLQFETLASQPGLESFPARCCFGEATETTLRRHLVEQLLPIDVIAAYAQKEAEFYTAPAVRTYCSNCRKWLPPKVFYDRGVYTLANCDCGTVTCVGCKETWEEHHRCNKGTSVKPEWMPEYSSDFRIKQCPRCRIFMEHKEACNHMTCKYCSHQFCWVCLLPWNGFHAGEEHSEVPACPKYGDPEYGEEGYENNTRGLHRDTGLDRQGRNRLGDIPNDHSQEPTATVAGDVPIWNEHMLINELQAQEQAGDLNAWDADAVELGPNDQEIQPEQGEWQEHGPEDWFDLAENYFVDLETNTRYSLTMLTYEQLDCSHSWDMIREPDNFHCSICNERLDRTGDQTCSECGVYQCDECYGRFWNGRSFQDHFAPEDYSMVPVIQWAENGQVPFRARNRANLRNMQEHGDLMNAEPLFLHYERQYNAANPEERLTLAEIDVCSQDWHIVAEENVGLQGQSMLFNLGTNSFAPLTWEERYA